MSSVGYPSWRIAVLGLLALLMLLPVTLPVPVLRGLVLGSSPLFLRTELGGGRGDVSSAGTEALWWPAAKIAARHLSPYLAEHAGLAYGPATGPRQSSSSPFASA